MKSDRNRKGVQYGPYSKEEFATLQHTGVISEDFSIWRQSFGSAYKVNIKRKFIRDKVCSGVSCSHMFELFTLLIVSAMTLFAFSIVDWKREKRDIESHGDNAMMSLVFIGILSVFTFIMVIFTIRTLYNRWTDSSTDVFVSEV